jgi:nitrite reductase/ring-hydroxylating ferredoxin subunit
MKYEIGKTYKIPCVIHRRELKDWEDWDNTPAIKYIPVYPLLHSDKENGQPIPHYHIDQRFLDKKDEKWVSYYIGSGRIEIQKEDRVQIHYRDKKCTRTEHKGITPVSYIKNSKLKHKCIHKGKCPHRGYDLSNEESVDGVITCPLHGLRFDSVTKQLLVNSPVQPTT